MPDVREVYEMVTKQKPPDPGALERQERRQVRAVRNRRYGAFAVAAAIALAVIVLALADRSPEGARIPAESPTGSATAYPAEPRATAIAKGFAEAVGAFDAGRAMNYLAPTADVPEGLSPEELPLLISLYEAQGYEQILERCRVTGTSASGTQVLCPFDFHMLRSEQIGRGPYRGSYWDITVLDGAITYAHQDWNIDRFSPEMWEPFAAWVSETHPKDFDAMYTGDGTNFGISEESIRLWERNSKEYVKEVLGGDAE